MNLPEGFKRLFWLVTAGYWAMALWWVDRIGLLVNARGGSTSEAEETTEFVSNGPPIEQLRDHLSIAHDHLITGMSSQPFFVFFILCVMYGGTCVLLFSMLWLMDGFRQDRAVSMTGRRH